MEFLKQIAPYVKIIRPVNLLMIGITQWVIYQYIIYKLIDSPSLYQNEVFLLILETMLVAAGGYVINDIIDYKTDVHNKPNKTFIQISISALNAKYYYFFLLTSGCVVAALLQYSTSHFPIIILYTVLCAILYLYSIRFKNSVLWGNILVSLMVSFVTGIIFFAESASIEQIQNRNTENIVKSLMVYYMIFSFLVNMIREIVKDIEDMDGDLATGHLTFPIKYGIVAGKNLCIAITTITLILLLVWMFTGNVLMELRSKTFLLLLIGAPMVIVIQALTKISHKHEFTKISHTLKWIMLSGLGSIVIISSEL
jgi:4-hydroxybenzoate polyprenyltransferase